MSYQHYIPAAFLANFSHSTDTVRRKRKLFVGNVHTKKCFVTSAERIGGENNFYTLINHPKDPNMIDNIWTLYERRLTESIEKLIAGQVDMETWVRVLVPFVTCMWSRGIDFVERFQKRWQRWPDANADFLNQVANKENSNYARLMEIQRLLAPVIAANWIVLEIEGSETLITNDVGFSTFLDPRMNKGIAMPIGHTHVLALTPRRKKIIASLQNNQWIPNIEYYRLSPNNHHGLNLTTSAHAKRFIVGPDSASVKKYVNVAPEKNTKNNPIDLREFILSQFAPSSLARAHEFSWHRLVSALANNSVESQLWDWEMDAQAIASDWHPFIILPTNLPMVPSAIRRQGDYLEINLFDVQFV